MITVERLVRIKQVILCDEARVDVAVFEVDGGLKRRVDMGHFGAVVLAEGAVVHKELSGREDDMEPLKGCMASGFLIQQARHLHGKVRASLW